MTLCTGTMMRKVLPQQTPTGLSRFRIVVSSRPLLGPGATLGAQRKLERRRIIDRSLVVPSLINSVEHRGEIERDVRVGRHERDRDGR